MKRRNRSRRAVAFAVLSLAATPLAAVAQHPIILERLQGWNAAAPAPPANAIRDAVKARAQQIYRENGPCAASEISIDNVEPATADRFAFNALVRAAVKNAWFVTARIPGCDPVPVRYMITRQLDDTLATVRVNRGNSHAWESLIGDTLPNAILAADAALERSGKKCQDNKPVLGILRIESEQTGLGAKVFGIHYQGSWAEVWPVAMCGKIVEVTVDFTADGDGGAYTRIPGGRVRVLP